MREKEFLGIGLKSLKQLEEGEKLKIFWELNEQELFFGTLDISSSCWQVYIIIGTFWGQKLSVNNNRCGYVYISNVYSTRLDI